MFGFFKKNTTPNYTIQQVGNRFAIVGNNNTVVRDYARRSDATRGANRLGLTIA